MTEPKLSQFTNSVFEQPWWLDAVAPGSWGEAVVRDGEKTIARLPYVLSGGRIALPPYTQTLGIWMDGALREKTRGNDHLSRQKEIIHELLKQLPAKKEIDLALHCSQEYVLPFRWEGFSITPTFSYRISNALPQNEMESAFSKGVRRDINKGSKSLFLDEEASVEEFLALQDQTYSRQNRKNPIDSEVTRRAIQTALSAGHGKLLLARDGDGAAHAGTVLLFDERCCYNLMSGQNTAFGNDCAMPFLLSRAIAFSRTTSQVFDFEGSMVEGIEQVYRRYGGETVVNWHVSRHTLIFDLLLTAKPRVKRLLGYRM